MTHLDNVHPRPIPHTLAEFNERALKYYDLLLPNDFIHFALAGIYRSGMPDDRSGPEEQATIHCNGHSVTANHELLISRYYGSICGVSRDILVNVPLKLHADAPYLRALATPVFVQRQVEHQDSCYTVDYSRIPNFEIGVFGDRNTLNVSFPRLWSPERNGLPLPQRLTSAEYDLWFKHGFVPAIRQLRIQDMEKDICPNPGGSLVAVEVALRLMGEVRSFLSSNITIPDWTRDFLVVHMVQGMTHSPLSEIGSSDSSLSHFLYDCGLHPSVPSCGEWYMDVGIQAASGQRHCLQWMTSAHPIIAREVLPSVDDVDAASLTELGAEGYQRDAANHLSAVGGFRLFPRARFPGYKTIRAYTSDEDLWIGSGNLQIVPIDEVLSQSPPFYNTPPTIEHLLKIYTAAREGNPSKARLEVRIPVQRAGSVLLNVDPAAITQSICVFESRDWWNFRLTRALAVREALKMQSRNASGRFLPENLTLTAALIWLVNSFSKHTDAAPATRALLNVVLPAPEDRYTDAKNSSPAANDTGVVQDVAYSPLGCIFLRRLIFPTSTVCFLPGGPTLAPDVFQTLFNGHNAEDLVARHQRDGDSEISRRVHIRE